MRIIIEPIFNLLFFIAIVIIGTIFFIFYFIYDPCEAILSKQDEIIYKIRKNCNKQCADWSSTLLSKYFWAAWMFS